MEGNVAISTIMEYLGKKQEDVNLTREETRKTFQLLGLHLTDEELQLLEDIPMEEFIETIDTQPSNEVDFSSMKDHDTISYNQFHKFLQNCHLDIPQNAITEFLAGCIPSESKLGNESLYMDKKKFNAFLQNYAAQKQTVKKNRNKKRKGKGKKRGNAP